MLMFDDIESLVEAQRRALLSRHPGSAPAVRSYKLSGGTERPWNAAGLYAYVDPDCRLVLEALYLTHFDACVVRVFQERPLAFYFGRKAIADIEACSRKIAEGCEHFQLHLPKQLLLVEDHEVASEWPEVDALLVPVPPPFSFADVPE